MNLLLDPIDTHSASRGGHVAVADQSLVLDYRSFRAVAAGLAGQITSGTAQPRVGVLVPTSSACAVAIFGCWYAGRTPVPLNFLLAPPELVKIIRDAELDYIITSERFAPLLAPLGVRTLELSGRTLAAGRAATPDQPGDATAAVIYTSGTAGDPKGVCLSYENLARNAGACVEAAELSPDQVFLGLLPQFHAFGLTANTVVPLLMGASVHFLPRFSPVAVAHLIEEKRVSVFITIASMFGALAAMKDAGAAQFASLTHPVSGGEPLPLKVAQLFESRFKRRIYEGFGMTEASPVVSLNTPRRYKLGSVGPPLPGITVHAVDEQDRLLPGGRDGELVIRGHCVMQGYLNKPELTARAIRHGGLYTGDIGHVDEDGFVFITGRAKEMMIVGGENVFPFEIENVLLDHPGVAEAAVIGARDEIRGEVPVGFVIPRADLPAPSESDLRSFCRDRLAAYKIPRQIVFATELPRGPTGKILKRALRVPGPAAG